MLLYHFSNQNFKILKTSFFGINHYSKNESKACSIPRSFFYNTEKPLECTLEGSKYRYTVIVDKNKIYDLDKDKQRLKDNPLLDIYSIINHLKALNYYGISYTHSFKCYCLFKDIKPLRQEILY